AGTHGGISNFTIGQRQGLPSGPAPRYVTRIDAVSNTIVIGRDDELDAGGLLANEVNLIRPERFTGARTPVLAMVRYRATPIAAFATVRGEGLELRFEQPVRAISPGQLVAIFDRGGDEVLGAGTITAAS
ncbi:MAG TPA: tRNA methyl transferase PRC-barrel domain-containing protein, partial [Candidatus Baltobacteraceae bacterium]|nr:tRNA methyl transferase PRC-barrel domain-containing protein [Candidatus Baltobacteraceae bacterium]